MLELTRRAFVRAGAELSEAGRARAGEIVERLASLGTAFSQNVLADEKSYLLLLDGEADLAGLPPSLRNAAARAAADRGHPGQICHHLGALEHRALSHLFRSPRSARTGFHGVDQPRRQRRRDRQSRRSSPRSCGCATNAPNCSALPSFADFKLDDTMAKTPQAVRALLDEVWAPALVRARAEREDLQARLRAEGGNFELAAHDWRYYAEKAAQGTPRSRRCRARALSAARQCHRGGVLHGKKAFRPDLPRAQRTFPSIIPTCASSKFAIATAGSRRSSMAIISRAPSKRSGAWMSSFRAQEKLGGNIRPIIVNVMNFAKAAEGEPSLLNLDDARTLFHEFGHALHGMLSDVTYPSISGTNVVRDFVEFPSQLFEHWLLEPDVLRRFARHVKTGAPMPEDLIARVLAARNFGQGFATVEYCASAFLDMDLHTMDVGGELDVDELERAASLARIGMPAEIALRHRPGHFLHVFAGGGYAAGYYSYLWSEVLDADGFAAFEETGDPFDRELALRLARAVYSAGGRQEAAEAYRQFRGRLPTIDALLEKRGLADERR